MTDREIIRELAKKYAQIAAYDVQKENAKMYRALNSLEPIRPVVLIDEIPWNQLQISDELKLHCEDKNNRRVEGYFRRQLYKWNHFRCDMILVNHFPWPRNASIGSYGMDIDEQILANDEGNNIVSHKYQDQIKTEEDIAKLHTPEITIDEEADNRDREWLEGLLGDILPIVQTGLEYVGFYEPWDVIAQWRGVEPLLWDLVDRPEFMHALVAKLTGIYLKLIDKAEDMGLLEASSPYIHSTAGLTHELPGELSGSLKRKNIWGRGAAQIFAAVSPAMLEEFEIPYITKFYEGFGLLYYGCCEPLHDRIENIRSLPNLRKISISPWADVGIAAEKIGSDFVLAHKPSPSLLATDYLDEEMVHAETLSTLKACYRNNTPVELTLKDISSVGNNPENLDRWAKVVMETVLAF